MRTIQPFWSSLGRRKGEKTFVSGQWVEILFNCVLSPNKFSEYLKINSSNSRPFAKKTRIIAVPLSILNILRMTRFFKNQILIEVHSYSFSRMNFSENHCYQKPIVHTYSLIQYKTLRSGLNLGVRTRGRERKADRLPSTPSFIGDNVCPKDTTLIQWRI